MACDMCTHDSHAHAASGRDALGLPATMVLDRSSVAYNPKRNGIAKRH